jgi:hypothetical protein
MNTPKRSYFRFRFSLRSYLLLVALLGIVVFPLATEYGHVRRETEALKRLQTSFAVEWRDDPSAVARMTARLFASRWGNVGKRVHSITFAGGPAPAELNRVAALHSLYKVEINAGPIRPPTTSEVVLPVPTVRTLIIREADLKNKGPLQNLAVLERFPNLRSLAVRGCEVTPKTMEAIERSNVRSLELFSLYNYHALPPTTELSQAKDLRRLKVNQYLLQRCPKLLNSVPTLEKLIVEGYHGDRHSVFTNLDLPRLRVVELGAFVLTQEDLGELARQPELTHLACMNLRLHEMSLRPLQTTHLESLILRNTHLTDAAMIDVAKIPTLQRLELSESDMRYKNVQLLNALPRLEVVTLPASVAVPADARWKRRLSQ